MPEFHALEPCPPIPDNLSIPQFILDSTHPLRPLRPNNVPWLVEDASGRCVGLEEVRYCFSMSYALSLESFLRRWFRYECERRV